MRLNRRERDEFDAAKMRGWYWRQSRERPNLENVWWRYCEAWDMPYIRITRRRKYAEVSFDLIAIHRRLTPSARDEVLKWMSETADLGTARSGDVYAVVGDVSGYVNRVLIERADDLAAKIHAIATAPGNTVKPEGYE